jgi:hypothetical protein
MRSLIIVLVGVVLLFSLFNIALVRADGTFGYDSVGGSSFNSWESKELRASKFTASEAGNVTQIVAHFSVLTDSVNWKAAIYADSEGAPAALLASSDAVSLSGAAAWRTFPMSYEVAASTVYWLGVVPMSDCNYGFSYDSGDANQAARKNGVPASTVPDPFGTPTAYHAYKFSIYANFTSLAEPTPTPTPEPTAEPTASPEPTTSAEAIAGLAVVFGITAFALAVYNFTTKRDQQG